MCERLTRLEVVNEVPAGDLPSPHIVIRRTIERHTRWLTPPVELSAQDHGPRTREQPGVEHGR